MRPPKSLAQNGDSGQGRGNGKRGSFGETTDNSFRNYMSRKIELQRKQFGLVLPPPPQPPLPPEILKEQARNSNVPTPQFAKQSPTDQLLHQSEKKSVRFHENSEKSVSKQNSSSTSASASAQSISEVLNQLKQRHTKKSKKHGTNSKKKSRLSSDHRRRNSSSQDMDKTSDKQTLTYDALNKSLSLDDTNAEHKNNQPGAECTSVLGVLDKLQKRHGTSGSKRKRTSKVSFSPILKRTKDNFDGVGLVAPTLQTQENYDSPCLNNLDASKRKREGYICQGKSVLEGLQNIQTNEGTEKCSKKTKASAETKAKYKLSANSPISPIGISCDSPKFSFEDLDAIDENYSLETDCISNSFFSEQLQQAPTTPVQPSRNQMLAQFTQFSPAIDSPSAHSTEEMPSNLASRRTTNPRPDLFFTGIVILVNGHTSPDATTLMRLLHKHGGDLEKYETRRVTHIIAERLSTAKANIYKRQKKPTPVCRPEWISDSVDKGKLLPHADYLVEDVKGGDDFGTKSVKSFFTSKQGDERASIDIHCHNRRVSERQDIDDECKQNSAEAKKASLLESRGDGSFSSNDQHEPRVASFKSRDISPLKGGSDSNGGICPATDLTAFENPSPHHRWHDKNPSSSNYLLNGNVRTVSNDPTFLESYFSNSRLSYIGSFKQRVKSVGNTASRSRSKSGAERFVLLVDMDCFFASVALKNYPEHRNKPVAVGHSGSNKSGNDDQRSFASRSKNSSCELSTCNYIARKYGIRKGMFLGDAIELCPDLVVLPYDFNGFEEVSSTVAERLHHYAEQYDGCVEQVSCDEAYVEIYLSPDDFPGSDVYEFVHSLAERIRKDIFDQTDCTASIGVGTNKVCHISVSNLFQFIHCVWFPVYAHCNWYHDFVF